MRKAKEEVRRVDKGVSKGKFAVLSVAEVSGLRCNHYTQSIKYQYISNIRYG